MTVVVGTSDDAVVGRVATILFRTGAVGAAVATIYLLYERIRAFVVERRLREVAADLVKED